MRSSGFERLRNLHRLSAFITLGGVEELSSYSCLLKFSQLIPQYRGKKLNTIVFSNFVRTPGHPNQNPGISRQNVWFSWASRDIPSIVAPTHSRGRSPPHRKISGPKSLGLCSFFLPDKSPTTHMFETARKRLSDCRLFDFVHKTHTIQALLGSF